MPKQYQRASLKRETSREIRQAEVEQDELYAEEQMYLDFWEAEMEAYEAYDYELDWQEKFAFSDRDLEEYDDSVYEDYEYRDLLMASNDLTR